MAKVTQLSCSFVESNYTPNHTCYKCKEIFPHTEEFFVKRRGQRHEITYLCKKCNYIKAVEHNKNVSKKENRQKINKRDSFRREVGICTRCKEKAIESTYSLCETHYLQYYSYRHLGSRKHWAEIKQILTDQNNCCAYSGLPLILGDNAGLDHIKPFATHPELLYEISNIQWVDRAVNTMKRSMREEDFLKLIELIYHHSVNKKDEV